MSDYGDEYSDYGEDWFYVEEEYVGADDLAEHAVPSPPPTTHDDDALLDWDRFDYYNDLEYASDGYDDASFEQNNGSSAAKIGQKRKRDANQVRERKRRRIDDPRSTTQAGSDILSNSPVVWRSRANRGAKPKMIAEDAEPYAVLKDWRAMTGNSPDWAHQTSQMAAPRPALPKLVGDDAASAPSPKSSASEAERDEEHTEDEEDVEEEEADLDPAALMAVLQERLAAAGGPLGGMDPQQLLQFAMRMANDKDAGDDIAGEMADEMLGMNDEEEDEEAEEQLLSWVAQQRAGADNRILDEDPSSVASTPSSNKGGHRRPITPPPSQANQSVCAPEDGAGPSAESTEKTRKPAENTLQLEQTTRKRKAAGTLEVESSGVTTKRRAAKSCEAPTASSQARTATTRSTRSGRMKR